MASSLTLTYKKELVKQEYEYAQTLIKNNQTFETQEFDEYNSDANDEYNEDNSEDEFSFEDDSEEFSYDEEQDEDQDEDDFLEDQADL